jgi:tetratricopeptide (TPR) repeat protein
MTHVRFVERRRSLGSWKVAVVATMLAAAGAAAETVVPASVEHAVLAEDWGRVAELLGPDDRPADAPVARLLKGHAYLALNRNNESVCMFLRTSDDEHLRRWDEWSTALAGRHPRSAVARYLRGDALARLRRWDPALAELDRAAGHALALNARGVVRAARGAFDDALLDFAAAAEADPRLADAHASRGVMYIQRKDGAEGAAKAFTRALDLSPTFVFALNGRGGVQAVLGRLQEARADLERAEHESTACLAAVLGLVRGNLLALADAEARSLTALFPVLAKDNPGTELKTWVRTASPDQIANLKGSLDWYHGHNSGLLSNPAFPKSIDLRASRTLELGTTAGVPHGKLGFDVSLGSKFDLHGTTARNMNIQLANKGMLDSLAPDVAARRLNPIEAQFRGTFDHMTRKMTHGQVSGGVSSDAIGRAHTDAGDWTISGQYGLLYAIRDAATVTAQNEPR